MRIVLDTNVLVSALLSPFQPPAQIVRLITDNKIRICFDPRILDEYRRVLMYKKFKIPQESAREFFDFIHRNGENIVASPLNEALPDATDLPFIEVAVSAHVQFLVTGNLRHFPSSVCRGFKAISPAEFLRALPSE